MQSIETLSAFRQFLTAVTRLRPAPVDHREQLAAFLARAIPLVVTPTRSQWRALQPKLTVMRRWFTDCDLLDRILTLEDSYTELISWSLRPATDPRTAEQRQRSWLASLGIGWRNETPVEPQTQMLTEDGVPDLVLSYRTQTVIVEVKTESVEHSVPSGNAQTVAYPDAVRSTLGVNSQHPIHMVFLTPDCRAADNPEAICTSFANFALALARALADVELIDELRVVFSMLITQFATYSSSSIKQAVNWQYELTDDTLIRRIGDISRMAKLLSGGSDV